MSCTVMSIIVNTCGTMPHSSINIALFVSCSDYMCLYQLLPVYDS